MSAGLTALERINVFTGVSSTTGVASSPDVAKTTPRVTRRRPAFSPPSALRRNAFNGNNGMPKCWGETIQKQERIIAPVLA
eukprot:CAMPEP_0115471628 /NCGR_PEP_ID=MMETSP0271-20121206/52622_1 /TAXON_ID=71861 /ORGANISM="Scrippsiella trochoidea, Strain CCMP3099" /LENGTH=80 /DNA_ID=CAMNT_0002898821 /DNA_START=1008 /DNA_END=1250 /DNA_ORIENTATION=-